MSNNYIIRGALKINDSISISGITNNINDNNYIATSNIVKNYINSKNNIGEPNSIIYNNNGTLIGTTGLTYDGNNLFINADINVQSNNSDYGGISNSGGFFINLINKTGSPTEKGKLVTYNFNNYLNGGVNTIELQSDGKILLGGNFNNFGNYLYPRIVRLNSNGTLDNSFNVGNGFSNTVNVIKCQTDGKILVGGQFNYYDSIPANRIIRLNEDGTIDTGFTYGTGFNGYVEKIALQSDGKIICVGSFSNYNSTNANGIIRLEIDGTIDSSFIIEEGFDSTVKYVEIQPNGDILVSGYFSTYKTYNVNNFAKLKPNGDIDLEFNKQLDGFEYFSDGTSENYIGVTLEDGIPDGYYTHVAIKGICDVKLSPSSAPVEIGGGLQNDVDHPGYAFSSEFAEFARSLESGNPGDTIKCLLLY